MEFSTAEFTESLIDEILPLVRLHYEEIAHYKDIPLDPDFSGYRRIAAMGNLRVFLARDEKGSLTGYNVFFIKENMHYKSSIQAVQDVLYVDPKRRGFGMKFINWCDLQLKNEGVQVVYSHIKKSHNFGELLERLGYELVDLIYARRLDKKENV